MPVHASALWRWWIRRATRHPATWLLAIALVLLIPLSRALSPFPALGVDPSWSLARGWALPIALAGTSAAMSFLTRHTEVLASLAPQTRWVGELGTLLVVPALLQISLALGALLGAPAVASPDETGWAGALVAWTVGCALLDLHLAVVAVLLLRVPARAAVRITGLVASMWLVPGLLGATAAATLFDPARSLRFGIRFQDSPTAALAEFATLLLGVAGLALLGRLLPPPRTAPGIQ